MAEVTPVADETSSNRGSSSRQIFSTTERDDYAGNEGISSERNYHSDFSKAGTSLKCQCSLSSFTSDKFSTTREKEACGYRIQLGTNNSCAPLVK